MTREDCTEKSVKSQAEKGPELFNEPDQLKALVECVVQELIEAEFSEYIEILMSDKRIVGIIVTGISRVGLRRGLARLICRYRRRGTNHSGPNYFGAISAVSGRFYWLCKRWWCRG